MPVDTAKVEGRRELDYQSFAELLADADRLSSGPVKTLGNWSAGQIYRHLALICNGSIDGYSITFPWYFRLAAKLFKRKIIASPMPPGFRLPPDGAETLVPQPASTEEGLAELHAAVARMGREDRRASHPIFGVMTREEWDRLHLKHASLHMSFLVPV
jgi:Protein of unknown function (DUF1569)